MFKCPIMNLLAFLSINILRVSSRDMLLSSKFSLLLISRMIKADIIRTVHVMAKIVIKTPAVRSNVHWSRTIKIREWQFSFKKARGFNEVSSKSMHAGINAFAWTYTY